MEKIKVEIVEKKQESNDICLFKLSSKNNNLPAFTAGAHIDVYINNDLVRQYSLCNSPDETSFYQIAVKKEQNSRGGSKAMHEIMQVGDIIEISKPRNNFPLDANADHSLLLAGGIGITPILSMAKQLHALGKPFELDYFIRSKNQAAFYDYLSSNEYQGKVIFKEGMEPVELREYLITRLKDRSGNAHLYLCGPRPFMDLIVEIASRYWPANSIHLEFFSAGEEVTKQQRGEFQIQLKQSDLILDVPEGKTIIEVLASNDIDVPTSCEQGVCGTCITRVISGEPDHKDVYLMDDEKEANDKICICISRSKSKLLVLDL